VSALDIDFSKIRVVEAEPLPLVRTGHGVISRLTQMIINLEPGQAFGIPTRGPQHHKSVQRDVTARARAVRKMNPGREYSTRTINEGQKLGGMTVKTMTLGVYRVK
jgi:hypothetical protein